MKPTDLREALPELLDLVRPLAAQHVVNLEFVASDGLPHQAVHPVALNQALLNLLSVAIPRTPGGHVTISAKPRGWEVDIQIHGSEARSVPRPTSEDDLTSLDMAGRLADLCGGRLTLSEQTEATFSATLTLPALERLPVLAIDDNADTLQLLQHFTTGTRYRLVGTRDPEQAIDLAQELSPQIIVLDIMMPQVDGWKVLGRLQHHPLTGHIPIIVCTILAQEELALSQGACGFLRKPVTQETLLAALDQQAARLGSESR
jgi:CheY-like chemotaxis protein